MPDEIYLGDGLYASFDGYSVTLRAPRMDGDHWVELEPQMMEELILRWRQWWLLKKPEGK